MKEPKPTKVVTYRRHIGRWKDSYFPELRISGKFLTKKYGLKVGDVVEIKYGRKNIVIKTGGDK